MNTQVRAAQSTAQPLTRLAAMLVTAVLLAAGLIAGFATPSHAATITDTVNGMTFEGDDETHTATLIDYQRNGDPDVIIPGLVTLSDGQNYTVTAIGESVFYRAQIETVSIPNSVVTIGEEAFMLTSLESVTIPNSVVTIKENAFYGSSLLAITIPDSVTTIENSAFSSNRLEEVVLGNSLTSLGSGAFGFNSVRSVAFPQSLTRIGRAAFVDNKLTSVSIPDSITVIEEYAFSKNNLTSAVIPGSVVEMGGGVFATNFDLASVTFLGAAPAIFFAGISGDPITGSLGDPDTGVVVTYPRQFESTGYTRPMWQGYPSQTQPLVSFDTTGGNAIAPVVVIPGETVAKPADPTRAGFAFAGWFTDRAATAPYDFASPVSADVTLYAAWTQVTHTVTFDAAGGSAVAHATVNEGDPVAKPADPQRADYVFTGWFTDRAATLAYDFASPVSADMTLYAGWKPKKDDSGGGTSVVKPTGHSGSGLAATGGEPAPWLPVTGAALLLAGAGALLARRLGAARK